MSYFAMVKGPKAHAHSVWLYWSVFALLVFFTVLTVKVAEYDFGDLNIVVALTIACSKASLVMAFFMHLAFDSKFLGVVISSSLIFLALFIGFSMLDLGTRADLEREQANFLPRDETVYKHRLDEPDALPLRPGLKEANPKDLKFVGPSGH